MGAQLGSDEKLGVALILGALRGTELVRLGPPLGREDVVGGEPRLGASVVTENSVGAMLRLVTPVGTEDLLAGDLRLG